MLPVAILAGGLGTRLRPLTETIPKAMLPIGGEPFIAHQLRLLRSRGVSEVVVCIGYLGEQIRDFVGSGDSFGLSVDYSWDGPNPLGTAGAIRRALLKLGDAFLVIYGDSYLPCDYEGICQAFRASGKQALMTVFRNEGRWDASNVEFSDGRIVRYDKKQRNPNMRHIDYGLGAFRSSAFAGLPDVGYDLSSVYQNLIAEDGVATFEVTERFYEIGSLEGIVELQNRLAKSVKRSNMNDFNDFSKRYLEEVCEIAGKIDTHAADGVVAALADTRSRGGRLFILGVGGSAGNASHAVNDFRKIAGIEAYAPTDNVSELTARTNDEGWPSVFESWLRTSRLRPEDCLLILSVGGGNIEKNVSPNLVLALEYARSVGAKITAIVGRDGGHAAQVADACVIIPTVNPVHVTPHSEAFQGIVWHLVVSHPALKQVETKWESIPEFSR